jgi:hypothetical protein
LENFGNLTLEDKFFPHTTNLVSVVVGKFILVCSLNENPSIQLRFITLRGVIIGLLTGKSFLTFFQILAWKPVLLAA